MDNNKISYGSNWNMLTTCKGVLGLLIATSGYILLFIFFYELFLLHGSVIYYNNLLYLKHVLLRNLTFLTSLY